MNEQEQVLELYIKEQQNKINELSQQIMMLTTRNKFLEEKMKEDADRLEYLENINRKKMNKQSGFIHKKKIVK
jgi:phage shock protein A